MTLFRRATTILLGLIFLGLLGLQVLTVSLQRDTSQEFFRVRGKYGGVNLISREETPNSLIRHVELINRSGDPVSRAYVRVPRNRADTYNVLLTYAGQKTGRQIVDLLPPSDHRVLVAVQYPYQEPETLLDYLQWPAHVRRAAYRTVAAGMLAGEYIRRDLNLEKRNIYLVGASLGSIFASIHGGLDATIPRVVIVHGGGDFGVLIRNSPRIKKRGWPVELSAYVSQVLLGVFDPIRYVGRIAPRPIVVLASRQDRYFPEQSVRALYRRAHQPKELIWTQGRHVGNDDREMVREIIRKIESILRRGISVEPSPRRGEDVSRPG